MSTPRRSSRIQKLSTPGRSTRGVSSIFEEEGEDTRIPLSTGLTTSATKLRARSRSRGKPARNGGLRSIAMQNVNNISSRGVGNATMDLEGGDGQPLIEKEDSSQVTDIGLGIPMSDKISMFLLLVLYTLQGIPMGLCMSLPIILKERGASYDDLTLLSLASTPFSLKLLWAPLVDTVFFKSIGRRKTWLVPIQLLTGLIMIVFAPMVVQWLGGDVNADAELVQTPTVFPLALFLLVIYFLMATQDIAVDGWALTMLSPANVGYASTCNSIGQTFGAFIANQGFISLSDATWCHRMIGTPVGETMATLSSFMSLAGYVFIVVTVAIALLKTEAPLPREEEPTGIKETYKQIGGLLHLAPVQKLLVILLTVKMSFAPADSVAIFEIM